MHFLDNSAKLFLLGPEDQAQELLVAVLDKVGVGHGAGGTSAALLGSYFGLFESPVIMQSVFYYLLFFSLLI